MKNEENFATASSDYLKELKRIKQQQKGTIMQYWAKQSIPAVAKTDNVEVLSNEFFPKSSQLDESDASNGATIEASKSGLSVGKKSTCYKTTGHETKAQNELRKKIDDQN